AAEVRASLAEVLPEYMVPAAVVVLEALPRLPNGKVDRGRLPAPDWAALVGDGAPRSPVEAALAGVFGEVLGLERVGVFDDFFALGGDSIVAMQLVARARRAGLVITPRQVFAQRTVAGLAAVAEVTADAAADARAGADEPLVALSAEEAAECAGAEEVWPLSPLQEGLLFHASFDAEPDAVDVYTVQMVFELEGPLDATRLRAAGQALLDRHPNLRAGFRYLRSGRAVAVVGDAVLPWSELDLSGLAAGARAEAWSACLAREGRRFDPAVPPLLRLALVRWGPERHRLVLTHQHLVLDGWSRGPLLAELTALYERGGDPAGLPEPGSYRDFLEWLARQDRQAGLAAWSEALAGLEEPTRLVPADPDREPRAPDLAGREIALDLAGASRRLGITVNTMVQAAWAVVLGRWTGRRDVVFGATVSGRPPELPGVESMVGLFINTVPVRVRLDPAETVAALLARLQDEQSRLTASHHVGLAEIQRRAGLGELFDSLVVFENFPDAGRLPGPAAGLRVVDGTGRDATHYPLTWLVEAGEPVELVAEYRPDLFEPAAVERMVDAMEAVLAAMVADPDRPVGRL
ncbi:MAG TPA: condensation domain-containing protein, partial [Actinomycetes bacterium]|nr:condensation domain-containing protein [Actinomycetes bacterium]